MIRREHLIEISSMEKISRISREKFLKKHKITILISTSLNLIRQEVNRHSIMRKNREINRGKGMFQFIPSLMTTSNRNVFLTSLQ